MILISVIYRYSMVSITYITKEREKERKMLFPEIKCHQRKKKELLPTILIICYCKVPTLILHMG